MHLLVTYDVSTISADGPRRLRRVARTCLDYGQRVQNSVFECKVDPSQYIDLKSQLVDIIQEETDSVRFYNLGSQWNRRVEHFGNKPSTNPDGPLII